MSEYAPDKKPENMSDRMSKKWPTFFEVWKIGVPPNHPFIDGIFMDFPYNPPFWVANLWKPPVI